MRYLNYRKRFYAKKNAFPSSIQIQIPALKVDIASSSCYIFTYYSTVVVPYSLTIFTNFPLSVSKVLTRITLFYSSGIIRSIFWPSFIISNMLLHVKSRKTRNTYQSALSIRILYNAWPLRYVGEPWKRCSKAITHTNRYCSKKRTRGTAPV